MVFVQEWLQRMEDPDNMTIKERKQWEEETELRAKNKILAQNFEVYIKKQREKMTYEDEHSRKSGIFGRAVETRIQEQYEDYLGVLNNLHHLGQSLDQSQPVST